MGKLNSDDDCVYYCGQESLTKNGVDLIVNKSPKCSTWVQSHTRQDDLFPGRPFSVTVMQACAPASNAEEAEAEWFLWRPTRPSHCRLVAKSCPTLLDLMDCSTPGLPVSLLPSPGVCPGSCPLHSDAIQPSHPLSSSPPAFNLYQHQGLFQQVGSS